jgi:hypothetical protein
MIDCHCPLDRLCKGRSTPWADDKLMTIVGLTKAIMRIRRPTGIYVRLLLAEELLSFQGWPLDEYVGGRTVLAQPVVTSLAGNAFSAFASGAVFMSALPMLHLQDPTAPAPLPHVEEDSDDVDGEVLSQE